jgi:MFS family permease
MDTFGAAIGPLLAIAYLHFKSEDLRSIYYWAIVPGLISVLFTLSVRDRVRSAAATAPRPAWSVKDFSPAFWRYLVAWGVFSIANSSDVFLLMKAKQSGASLTTVILLYCFYNLLYSFASPYFGSLSDRVGRAKILASGLIVFSLVYAGFAYATETAHYWILFGVYGIYMAATDGVGKSLAVEMVPKDRKASGIGLLGSVTGLAAIVASGVAGYLWDHVGATSALLYGSVGAVMAAGILLTMPSRK